MQTQDLGGLLNVNELGSVHGVRTSPTFPHFVRRIYVAWEEANSDAEFLLLITALGQRLEYDYLQQLRESIEGSIFEQRGNLYISFVPLAGFLSFVSKDNDIQVEIIDYKKRVEERRLKDIEEGRTGPHDFRIGDIICFHGVTLHSAEIYGEDKDFFHTYRVGYDKYPEQILKSRIHQFVREEVL